MSQLQSNTKLFRLYKTKKNTTLVTIMESENSKWRDYDADSIFGNDYRPNRTPAQRERDADIAAQQATFINGKTGGIQKALRAFLERARYFTEPDVIYIYLCLKYKYVYIF